MSALRLSTALVTASWLAVRPARLAAVVTATLLLVAVTAPWQDSGHAVPVLHGVALLLACAVAMCTDDPAAEVVEATPHPRHLRTAARLLLGVAVVLPVHVLAAAVAEARFDPTPLTVHAVEAATLLVVAAGAGAVLRARGASAPAYPSVLGLLVFTLALVRLPGPYTMIDPQPWGPPLEGVLIRWSALALLACAALALALRDPGRAPR